VTLRRRSDLILGEGAFSLFIRISRKKAGEGGGGKELIFGRVTPFLGKLVSDKGGPNSAIFSRTEGVHHTGITMDELGMAIKSHRRKGDWLLERTEKFATATPFEGEPSSGLGACKKGLDWTGGKLFIGARSGTR